MARLAVQPRSGGVREEPVVADRAGSTIECEAVSVRYGTGVAAFLAVQNLDLDVRRGEFLALVGRSGCGKSSLLFAMGGLLKIASGVLRVAGTEVTGAVSACSFVFQDASLLPWRSVLGNVALGLEIRRVPRSERRDRAMAALNMVGLGEFAHRYPHQLSGGMQQRVNLARALVCEPEILLMDEPFASLDALTRESMQQELIKILGGRSSSTVFVTHQIDEAVYLADRVVVMGGPPGNVMDVVEVPFGRPRDSHIRALPEFRELEMRLREELLQVGEPWVGRAPVLSTARTQLEDRRHE